MFMLISVVVSLINILELLVIIRCILSWIPGFQNAFVELIYKLTDPFLLPIQKALFRMTSGQMFIDISPIILFFLLRLVTSLLYRILI
ncbi:MAG: YggT family protein [Clostridia bacterium]|nr:YggT family protein [Clostridia bacterium]